MQSTTASRQQDNLRNADLPSQRKMEFRIGINVGDVVVEGEQLYGDGVNVAARLQGLADAGGIFISGTVYDQVENKLALDYEYLGEQAVKNIAGPIRVWRVLLEPRDAATASKPVLRQAQHEREATPVTLSLSKGDRQTGRVGSAHVYWVMVAVASLLLIIGGTVGLVRYAPKRHTRNQGEDTNKKL